MFGETSVSDGLNGVDYLGRRLLSSQAKNFRGLQEHQLLIWIGRQMAPSKLGRQGLRLLLPQFPPDWPLCLVIRYPTVRECRNANSRTFVNSYGSSVNYRFIDSNQNAVALGELVN